MGLMLSSSSATVLVAAECSHNSKLLLLLNAGADAVSGGMTGVGAGWLGAAEFWRRAGTKDIAFAVIEGVGWFGFL